MKRILKILAIVVVVILAGTYVIYASEYQGNYNVTAKVTLSMDMYGTPTISAFSSSNKATSPVQFWDLFKGHGLPENTSMYSIYYTMALSSNTIQGVTVGKSYQGVVISSVTEYGTSSTSEFGVSNVEPGIYTMSLTLKDSQDATVLTHSYEVVVGP